MSNLFPDPIEPIGEHQVAADQLAFSVIKRAEGAGIVLSSEIRREAFVLLRRLMNAHRKITGAPPEPVELLSDFLREFPRILQRYEPLLARTISDAQIAAWLQGGQNVLKDFRPASSAKPAPPPAQRIIIPGEPLPPPPSIPILDAEWEEEPPIIRFPIIEHAAADMLTNGILTPATYGFAQRLARMEGFDSGRKTALDVLEKVRDSLVEAVVDGDSVATFKSKIHDAIEGSGLSEKSQEMLFRNVVLRAYARGQKAIVEQPLIRSVAVFAWRTEIDDGRLTQLCRALSHSGLPGANGQRTSIFAVADPVWRIVAPQSHHGCRCGTIFLTVKRAAEKGILVAQKWHQSGKQPPDSELFVPMPDLSMIPDAERRQFATWESPWAATAA